MGYQKQKGVYGALVIEPNGEPLIKAERDYVVLLSDWMDGSPLVVENNLKHMSDYYTITAAPSAPSFRMRGRTASARRLRSGRTGPTCAWTPAASTSQPVRCSPI